MTATSTNHKGHVAELAVALDLAARFDYSIGQPLSPAPYDLIAVTPSSDALFVQVKTCRRRKRGRKEYVVIDCTNGNGRRYKPGTVDLFAGYDAETEEVYYIRFDQLDGRRELWIDPTKVENLM